MKLLYWDIELEIGYEPKMRVVALLECSVCGSTLCTDYNVGLCGHYGDISIGRPSVAIGSKAKVYLCSGCGVCSVLIGGDYERLNQETGSLTKEWATAEVWFHFDFPASQYAKRLSEQAAEYHQKRAEERAEKLRLAGRTLEQVETDRWWRERHRWCSEVLSEELERIKFYPAFTIRCHDCGGSVSRQGYKVGEDKWTRGWLSVCETCAEKRYGCRCQTTKEKGL